MSVDAETLYGLVAGASAISTDTASGVPLPDTLIINAAKLYMNDAILRTGQRLADIGGGVLATRPSNRDLSIPRVGDLLLKYHKGRDGIDVEDRLKVARLCESLSGLASMTPILSVIAAGPPATQRLNFRLMTDLERDRRAAERLAGVAPENKRKKRKGAQQMKEKAIITAAITGSIHTPGMSEYLPVTPQEIADDAVRAYEAGAAVCHIHARDPQTGQPTSDVNVFREAVTRIKSRCDMVVCITTGGGLGMTAEQRLIAVSTFKPELASFNAGSVNFALFHALERYKNFKFDWESKYLAMTEDYIFPNTFKSMKDFARIFNENGTKPEFEVYDSGMVNNIAFMIDRGYVKKPVYIQYVMGVLGGITPSPENVMFLVDYTKRLIGEGNFEFSVCVAGRAQFPICTQSLLIGGNARVGLEDNLYLEKGRMAKSNAEQVTKIVRIAREFGIEPATPDEARKILGLKGIDKVNY